MPYTAKNALDNLIGTGRYLTNIMDLDTLYNAYKNIPNQSMYNEFAGDDNPYGYTRASPDHYLEAMNTINAALEDGNINLDTWFKKRAEIQARHPPISPTEAAIGNAVPWAIGGVLGFGKDLIKNPKNLIGYLTPAFKNTLKRTALTQAGQTVFDPKDALINGLDNTINPSNVINLPKDNPLSPYYTNPELWSKVEETWRKISEKLKEYKQSGTEAAKKYLNKPISVTQTLEELKNLPD